MPTIYKIPQESSDYAESSAFVVGQISAIMENAIKSGWNRIFIHTNLKRGLPLENINKVAGPFVEAWALEQFEEIVGNLNNQYALINVEAGKRLDPFDIVLQFKRTHDNAGYISANVDVKATAEDIKTAGKSPNITSFARIRSEYVKDADYIFVVLSLKHRVYGERDAATGMTNGIMEVVAFAAYDLKYISAADLNYNPALGTGQLQIRDIHYVEIEMRTTWEFLQMLDAKFIRSQGKKVWLALARKYEWIKESK
ncbi:MAG: restriction endonuclease [Chloroflexi bacterium]|nr:restriction endonuclease [Chloroflexota bacterium]